MVLPSISRSVSDGARAAFRRRQGISLSQPEERERWPYTLLQRRRSDRLHRGAATMEPVLVL